MTTRLIITGFLGLTLLFGCEKNNENDFTQIYDYPNNAKLKRILLYASADAQEPISITEEYEYDSLDRISKVSSPMYEDGVITGTIKYDTFSYNLNGQLENISNYNANLNAPTGFINLINYTYFYSTENLRTKELTEFPQINSFEYKLYKYSDNQLIKVEKYDNSDQLESYTIYEYNNLGEVIKETLYSADDEKLSSTMNTYVNGLNTFTEVYSGTKQEKIREIKKTHDSNGNLIMLESNELMPYSSAISYVMRYEYYED